MLDRPFRGNVDAVPATHAEYMEIRLRPRLAGDVQRSDGSWSVPDDVDSQADAVGVGGSGINLGGQSRRWPRAFDLQPFPDRDILAAQRSALKPYAYVAQNPLSFIDPTGLETWVCEVESPNRRPWKGVCVYFGRCSSVWRYFDKWVAGGVRPSAPNCATCSPTCTYYTNGDANFHVPVGWRCRPPMPIKEDPMDPDAELPGGGG